MLWIGLFVGLALGFVIWAVIAYRSPVGTICVYENEDGGEPYMFLVLERDVSDVLGQKRVVLKIEVCDNPNRSTHK